MIAKNAMMKRLCGQCVERCNEYRNLKDDDDGIHETPQGRLGALHLDGIAATGAVDVRDTYKNS